MRDASLVVLLLLAALPGCLQDDGPKEAWDQDEWLGGAVWDTSAGTSKVLEPGLFEVLPPERHDLIMPDGTRIAMVVWRPATEPSEKVPVILDAGPYYSVEMDQLDEREYDNVFLVQNFVPHGFAFGRVAVPGSGASSGCTEFFGAGEQAAVDAAVTYYGNRDWSNGRVALFGGSYDGAIAWAGAAQGNPHLATIVTIAGASDIGGFLIRNGTADERAGYMHTRGYWLQAGFMPMDRSAQDRLSSACPELGTAGIAGAWGASTGDRDGPAGVSKEYWETRDWQERVIERYQGSVFVAHGLQDRMVPPTTVLPFARQLQETGIEVKMLLGQWGHDTPDSIHRARSDDPVTVASVRWDFAEVLRHWFDRHLLPDIDSPTGPAVDVQDSRGAWRIEETWPPRDAVWTEFYLGDGTLERTPEDASAGSAVASNPGMALGTLDDLAPDVLSSMRWTFDLGTLEQDLRFSGLVRAHLTVTPSSPLGGNLRAELRDVATDGEERVVAWGVMNLRYHDGGDTPATLVPGEPIRALMEFLPADVVVSQGNNLRLTVWPDTGDGHHGSVTPTPITLHWGGETSILKIPVIDRIVGDGKYPGQP